MKGLRRIHLWTYITPAELVSVMSIVVLALVVIPMMTPEPPREFVRAQQSRQLPVLNPLDPYRGLGTWIDIYDRDLYQHPAKTIRAMQQAGITTVYLQIGTDSTPRAGGFAYPRAASKLIDQAHQHHMYVVGWYLPDFLNLRRDARRIAQGIEHRTPGGNRIDGFALDIESIREPSRSIRNRRLVALSKSLRARLGAQYPLGAIVPDSTSTAPSRSLWPGFPYREIAHLYQSFLPMAYSNYRGEGPRFVRRYSKGNIRYLRAQTGRRQLPIHFIGGESTTISPAEARALAQTTRQENILGVSLYGYPGSQRAALEALGAP